MYEYNKNFNWVKSWSKTHFKYILKTILPFIIILTTISLYLIFFKNHKNKNKVGNENVINNNCLFGLISFFTIFPIYRYGYSYLITIISLIVIYLNKNKIGLKQNIFIFKFFFIICITSLITKQFVKISKNYSQKEIWPNIYSLSEKNNSYKKIILNENFHYYYAYNGDNLCMYSTSPCTSYKLNTNIIASKKFNYDIISLKSNMTNVWLFQLTVSIFVIISISQVVSRLIKISLSKSFIVSVALIILISMLLKSLDLYKYSVNFLITISIIPLFFSKIRENIFEQKFFIIEFLILLLILFYFSHNRILMDEDELYFWAVKYKYLIMHFQEINNYNIDLIDEPFGQNGYGSATAFFQAFITSFIGYNEGGAIFANNIIILCILFFIW